MDSFNFTFLLSLSIIVLGYLLKAIRVLSEDHGKYLSKIILNVTLPALILRTISSIELDFSLVLAPLICILFSLIVSLLAGLLLKRYPDREKGVAWMSSLGFNIGLFAYPIMEGLFGREGLTTVAMLDFGNAFIVFGLSYFMGFRFSEKRGGRSLKLKEILLLFLRSIPFMSYMLAIVMNVANLSFPPFLGEFLDILGRANMGMVLLVLGLTLSFRFDTAHWKLIFTVIGLRYATGFVAGGLLYLFLPFSQLYRTVMLFGLLLPVGMSVIPFSVEFDYDSRISSTIANFTMIISFVWMWAFMIFLS